MATVRVTSEVSLNLDQLEALVELAQLRGVTLPDLMTQLGLRSPAVYA
jgi:hypothetical protein